MAKRVRKIKLEDGREIPYIVTRKMSNRIKIRLNSAGVFDILADKSVKIKVIEDMLIRRADTILEQREHFLERNRTYSIEVGKIQWLGAVRSIEIIRNPLEIVNLRGTQFRVFTMHPEQTTEMLNSWMHMIFEGLVNAISIDISEELKKNGLIAPPTKVTVKEMKTRWGSCSYTRGRISINYELRTYPIDVVRAVMWHEYAHYWHPDHSEAFYLFVEKYFPAYRYWHSMLK